MEWTGLLQLANMGFLQSAAAIQKETAESTVSQICSNNMSQVIHFRSKSTLFWITDQTSSWVHYPKEIETQYYPYFVQNLTQCGMLQCNLGQLSTLLSGQFLQELLPLSFAASVYANNAVSFRGHIKNVRCMIKSKERATQDLIFQTNDLNFEKVGIFSTFFPFMMV